MSRISDTHPELFHYTTAAGLSGILESKSFWATHSSFVNDAEEILGFYDRILPRILRPIFQKYYEEVKHSPAFKKEIGNKTFEKYCDEQFSILIDIFRTTASSMHDHYITSFSTPNNEWIREHGLLSQWRAYGPDGGYAIVFDTTPFDNLLSAETIPFQEELFSWVDVQYYLNENRRTGDLDTDKWIEELEIGFDKFFRSPSADNAGKLAQPLTILSSLFKHRGFEEEQEVRFVLSLLGPKLESEPELQSIRQHPIKTRVRMGESIPYVELCVQEVNGVRQNLPIKRIIVGPHQDKHNRKRAIQLLLKQHGLNPNIVTVSDIPYRG